MPASRQQQQQQVFLVLTITCLQSLLLAKVRAYSGEVVLCPLIDFTRQPGSTVPTPPRLCPTFYGLLGHCLAHVMCRLLVQGLSKKKDFFTTYNVETKEVETKLLSYSCKIQLANVSPPHVNIPQNQNHFNFNKKPPGSRLLLSSGDDVLVVQLTTLYLPD